MKLRFLRVTGVERVDKEIENAGGVGSGRNRSGHVEADSEGERAPGKGRCVVLLSTWNGLALWTGLLIVRHRISPRANSRYE